MGLGQQLAGRVILYTKRNAVGGYLTKVCCAGAHLTLKGERIQGGAPIYIAKLIKRCNTKVPTRDFIGMPDIYLMASTGRKVNCTNIFCHKSSLTVV
jgi:hypothetical protein